MKTQIVLTTLAALLPLAVLAQSPTPSAPRSTAPVAPPVPPAPPGVPAPPAPPMHRHFEREDRPKEPVTYLGVETSDVRRVLSEQLGLPRGFGVVVDYVVPNSPAAAAGVQQSDIIRMLNDQLIVEPGQLGKLVRSFADGTTVNLTLLRKGKEVKVTVKLVKHEPSSEHGPFGFEHEWKFPDMGKMDFDFHAPDMAAVREAVARAKDEALRAGDEARKAVRKLRIVTTDDDTLKTTRVDLGNANITFSDEQGELKLESVDGKKTLTAKNAQGKILFSGPINTKEERAKVPENVRRRFEKLEEQDLPAIPPAPEPPKPPGENESVKLQSAPMQRACLSPNNRTGWVRSTVML
jgi:hypothetical protein